MKDQERPIECTTCSKSIAYKYTEVNEKITQRVYMCSNCPALEQFKTNPTAHKPPIAELVCGRCSTHLKDVLRGGPMGCSECYSSFENFIMKELKNSLAERTLSDVPNLCHVGHSPYKQQEASSSLKMLALNEALNRTIEQEDYEQAAWIRDQIKQLKKRPPKS